MLQVFVLGLVGFVLVKKGMLSPQGLDGLTDFFIGLVFPALIFGQIVREFDFKAVGYWWLFPLLSLGITGLGLLAGYGFGFSLKDAQTKREFIALSGFQNSGYLPLVLLKGILPPEQLGPMLIYLFLFLLGFNLVIWSWGVSFLSARPAASFGYGCGYRKPHHRPLAYGKPNYGLVANMFSWASLFSPPVLAVILGLVFVILKIGRFIPQFILFPIEMLGNCSFPLAMVVVGASLAQLYNKQAIDLRNIIKLSLLKLCILPLLGLLFLSLVRLPYLIGLLIILELAVPSATNLAIITRKYARQEKIISQGIFFSHILSLITLPVFLTLFNIIVSRR